MKPKNVMLLGFVNKAIEYLDEHLDDEADPRLAELKNIDLSTLREELNENLGLSLGSMQSTMTTLLKAGDEAFDRFVTKNGQADSASTQLGRMFDVDFDEDDENKLADEKELAKLLAFYNLERDFESDGAFMNEPIVEETKEPEEILIEPEETIIEPIEIEAEEPEIEEIKIEEKSEPEEEKPEPEEQKPLMEEAIIPEGDDVMRRIFLNVSRANDPNLDPYSETVGKDIGIEREIDTIFSEIIAHEEGTLVESDTTVDDIVTEEPEEIAEETIETIEEEPAEEEPSIEETEAEEPVAEDKNDYVNELIEDIKQEETAEEKEDEEASIIERIHSIYTYLDEEFIANVYGLKDTFAAEYPIDKKIIVLHRLVFSSLEDLRQFVEITLSHGYMVNADENKMIVDVFKEFVNADGKILTNIFEVANQGSLLNAVYDGYNVLINEI